MPYICLDCGNRESFDAYQDTTEYKTEEITIDGNGEITDWGNSDCNDSDITSGPNEITCSECESSNVENVDWDEIYEIEARIKNVPPKKIDNWKEEFEK